MTTDSDGIRGLMPAAWRHLSSAKNAKWTVQKNYPAQLEKWDGYKIEPLYSADALRTAIAERDEARARHGTQMDYSIDLQRIIEDICHGRSIRTPATDARHHYDMAVAFAALQSAQAQGEGWRLVGCIDRYGKLFASAENHKASTLIELGWTAVYAPTPDTGKGDGR